MVIKIIYIFAQPKTINSKYYKNEKVVNVGIGGRSFVIDEMLTKGWTNTLKDSAKKPEWGFRQKMLWRILSKE